jgi:transposase
MVNYAYIKDNKVINIVVFDSEKSQEFLDSWKDTIGVDLAIKVIDGVYIGQDFIDGEFIFPDELNEEIISLENDSEPIN